MRSVELEDGSLVAIEIKYRMNWLEACQSNSQLRSFLEMNEKRTPKIPAAIVFFEEFSGDWDRKMKSHSTKLGWIGWYVSHEFIDGIRFHAVNLKNGIVETYEDALKSPAPSGL